MTIQLGNQERDFLIAYPSIYNMGKLVNCEKKEIIIHEGTKADYIYYLIEGLAFAYKTSENGQLRTMEIFKAGDFFGNITLFSEGVYTINVEAFKQCSYLQISKNDFEKLVIDDPNILRCLYADIANKLRRTSQIIIDHFLTAEERVVRSILMITKKFGYETSEGIELRIVLTHDELARIAGTTRVTVTRTLSKLAEEGILGTKPRPWIIYKLNELKSYA